MGAEITKTCKVCGAEYKVCLSCERNHGWKAHTDTLEHYYIFLALMSYEVSRDAKKVYRVLLERGIDLRNTEGLNPYAQRLLAEIDTLACGEDSKAAAETKPAAPAHSVL